MGHGGVAPSSRDAFVPLAEDAGFLCQTAAELHRSAAVGANGTGNQACFVLEPFDAEVSAL